MARLIPLGFLTVFALLIAACAPRPIRPVVADPNHAGELDHCEYLYSQCLGRPSPVAPDGARLIPGEWQGEPEYQCNRKLKSCYDTVLRSTKPDS